MNNKGFTLIELIVSFLLVTVITFGMFRAVLGLERIQKQNLSNNALKAFELVVNSGVGYDFLNKKIESINTCGENCYNIVYSLDERNQIKIDKVNGIYTYNDLSEMLPNGFRFIDDIEITKYVSDSEGLNSYVYLTMYIKGDNSSDIIALKYMYCYDSTESEILFDNIPDDK